MSARRQLPVSSPLDVRSLLAGVLAAATGSPRFGLQLSAWVRERFGSLDYLALDSGTTALGLAIRAALEDRPGPVALPAYCCYDVATAAIGARARVVLYDVSPETLGPDLDSLRAAVHEGASAVVVAHLFGLPVDVSAVRTITRETDAIVIDDAAQGIGAELEGRPLGAHGALGVLSFGRAKGLSGGSGGLLLANDDAGRRLLESIRSRPRPPRRGWADLATGLGVWAFGRPALYRLPSALPFLGLGETVYRPPHDPRLAPAAMYGILSRTTAKIDADAATRRRHAERLGASLTGTDTPLRPFPVSSEARAGYLRFPVTSDDAAARRSAAAAGRSLGVMPGYPTSLNRLEPLRDVLAGSSRRSFPGAEALAARLLTLPTHGRLAERDLQALEGWLRDM